MPIKLLDKNLKYAINIIFYKRYAYKTVGQKLEMKMHYNVPSTEHANFRDMETTNIRDFGLPLSQ